VAAALLSRDVHRHLTIAICCGVSIVDSMLIAGLRNVVEEQRFGARPSLWKDTTPLSETPLWLQGRTAVVEAADPSEFRHGIPDYHLSHLVMPGQRTTEHAPGSLEAIVESIVQVFEMEVSHKKDPATWVSMVTEHFRTAAQAGCSVSYAAFQTSNPELPSARGASLRCMVREARRTPRCAGRGRNRQITSETVSSGARKRRSCAASHCSMRVTVMRPMPCSHNKSLFEYNDAISARYLPRMETVWPIRSA